MSTIKADFSLCPLRRPWRITALCSAFLSEYEAGFYFAGESHDFYEAVFVLDGKAGITAGNEILNLHKGQMIFHPPIEFHRIWNASDETMRVLIFTFSLEEPILTDHCVRQFTPAEAQQMIECTNTVRDHCVMNRTRVTAIREDIPTLPLYIAINRIETLFMTLHVGNRPETSPADMTRSARSYSDAVSFLQENLRCRLSVDDIARHCRMSRSSLQKMFLRYAGVGVMTYYHRLQIILATDLLKSGCMVKEVAATLGFEDQNYFSRFFSSRTGISPSRYRQKSVSSQSQ